MAVNLYRVWFSHIKNKHRNWTFDAQFSCGLALMCNNIPENIFWSFVPLPLLGIFPQRSLGSRTVGREEVEGGGPMYRLAQGVCVCQSPALGLDPKCQPGQPWSWICATDYCCADLSSPICLFLIPLALGSAATSPTPGLGMGHVCQYDYSCSELGLCLYLSSFHLIDWLGIEWKSPTK